jgi:hypothetical protein
MQLPALEINEQNYVDVSKKLKVISNKLHLKILLILGDEQKTNDEVFVILKKEGLLKNRSASYKSLEKLVRANIIKKEYIKDRKRFMYYL